MADLRAFEAVADGVFGVFRQARSRVGLSDQPEFKAVTGPEMLLRPVTMGVTLLVHEAVPSPVLRTEGRVTPDAGTGSSVTGDSGKAALNMEMRFILSMWAPDALVEHRLAAWVIDCLARRPIISAEELNHSAPDCFSADERVTITPLAIPFAELMSLWAAIGSGRFRLSLPYVATGIRIDRE